MTGTSDERCGTCRGRGWKLLTLRRSLTSAGDAGERAPLQRSRIQCLTCGGTGRSLPDATVTAPDEKRTDDGHH